MQADVASGALHPMQAKKNLAHTITRDFHSQAAADAAAESWAKQFQQKSVSEDIPVIQDREVRPKASPPQPTVSPPTTLRIPKLLQLAGLAASTGEATRKLTENAVSINGEKFSDRTIDLDKLGDSPILRLGKRAVRIEWL